MQSNRWRVFHIFVSSFTTLLVCNSLNNVKGIVTFRSQCYCWKQRFPLIFMFSSNYDFLLTTSRGYSPAVHMCREHSSGVTPCAPPAAQEKPEHCVPASGPLCSVCRPPRLPPKPQTHTHGWFVTIDTFIYSVTQSCDYTGYPVDKFCYHQQSRAYNFMFSSVIIIYLVGLCGHSGSDAIGRQ